MTKSNKLLLVGIWSFFRHQRNKKILNQLMTIHMKKSSYKTMLFVLLLNPCKLLQFFFNLINRCLGAKIKEILIKALGYHIMLWRGFS